VSDDPPIIAVRPEGPIKPPRSRVWATVKMLVRTRLTTGLITILPIVLTAWLVKMVFGWLRDASQWVVVGVIENEWFQSYVFRLGGFHGKIDLDAVLQQHPGLDWGISVFSVLLTIALLYFIGLFMANVIGQRLMYLIDVIANRLPFVKTIYGTLKQILALFGGDQTKGFQRVALVPFPNQITRSVGFITNTMRDAATGDELCAVFIATTPNPTTGFVFILKRSDITEVSWSVEDAVKIIMSGGILSPEYVTMVTGAPGIDPHLALRGAKPAPPGTAPGGAAPRANAGT